MRLSKQIVALMVCFIMIVSTISPFASADYSSGIQYSQETVQKWLNGWGDAITFGGWNPVDQLGAFLDSGKIAVSSKPQKYYTTPTSSVQDKYGNVTNYYRGGDTTSTKIIDSYNKTFNTIHNTTNNTNNYQANVKLSDFLNSYTTNNNNYTYSADFKSWYYDNTKNEYNFSSFTKNDYTQNNLYYNQDNSRYYISIDNSTDEYYLIDVQYSPTFVTVNYTYNTTNNNYEKPGDVTNVYYYELKDGRNSSTLTASEIAGLDLGYDTANYELVADDPNTLSLQHFDGDYTDSSSYGRTFYSENRSTNYVDSGSFGKAVSLPNGSAAGVKIPNLSSYSSLSFDFRIYYSDISKLGIYFGDTNLFQEVVPSRKWTGADVYADDGKAASARIGSTSTYSTTTLFLSSSVDVGDYYTFDYLKSIYYPYHRGVNDHYYSLYMDNSFLSQMSAPSSYASPGYDSEDLDLKKFGWMSYSSSVPFLYSSQSYAGVNISSRTYSYDDLHDNQIRYHVRAK